MEVKVSRDLEDRLRQAAGRRRVSTDVPVSEAIERAVDYDDWFIRQVENGLPQIEAGEGLTHDPVGARLEQKLTERRQTGSTPRQSGR